MSIAHALFTLGAGDLYFQVIHGDVGRITDTAMFIVGMWLHVIALYLFYRDDIIASKLALGE